MKKYLAALLISAIMSVTVVNTGVTAQISHSDQIYECPEIERVFLTTLDEQNAFVLNELTGDGQAKLMSYVGEVRLMREYNVFSGNFSRDDGETGIFAFILGWALGSVGGWKTVAEVITAGLKSLFISQALLLVDRNCNAETWHTNYYNTKYAQVYDYYPSIPGWGWMTYYTSRSLDQYLHYRGWLYVDFEGSPVYKAYAVNYTRDEGYAPAKTLYAPYYNNEPWLTYEAYRRYSTGLSPGYEDWNSVIGDPERVVKPITR